MSHQPASRAANFQDLLDFLARADLPERRRQELRSALRTAARLLGRNPAALPVEPRTLAKRLDEVSPITHGLSPGRWHNIRSLLRTALALAGPVMTGRSRVALLPAWAALLTQVTSDWDRMRLAPVMRWASGEGVGPGGFSQEHLEAFRAALFSQSLRKHPAKTWRNLRAPWNRAAARIAGFPQVRIEAARPSTAYALPWSAFPASLKQDVEGWLDRLAGRDLADGGPGRPVRPSTLASREYQLRAFASALVHVGTEAGQLRSLKDLVRYEAFVAGLRFHRDRAGKTTTHVHEIAAMLKSVATHWVRLADPELERMASVVRRLKVPNQGLTAKNRDRLRPFNDSAHVARLITLPQTLRRHIEARRLPPQRAAVLAGTAVAIELLLFTGIRRQNLAAIDLERDLQRIGTKTYLVFCEEAVKNGVPLEFELPQRSLDLLDWYLRQHRPHLTGHAGTALFPGPRGGSKRGDTLGRQIIKTVLAFTGLKVSPHLFRHIGAKIYLDRQPGQYEVIRRVLGHKSMNTTIMSYTGLETRAAARHFDAVIEQAAAEAIRTVTARKEKKNP